MVKSFQGVRRAPVKEIQQLQVSDFMTVQLTRFHPEQSIDEVVQIMINKNISGGPVLDDSGQLVGMISEGDCLKEIVRGKYNNSPCDSGQVKDHMVHNVISIDPKAGILDAAKQFLEKRVRRFPVMQEGVLIGMVSQRDVMRAVQSLKNETW